MIITKEVEYRSDGILFRGFCAYPARGSNLSAILIAPSWSGRNMFSCEKAIYMAKKGYLAFVIDVYGDAKVGNTDEENYSLMTPLITDKYSLMTRLRAAYSTVSRMTRVDKHQIAAMGFCFGGRCVLEMARSNLELKGVISFHGSLESNIIKEETIDTKVLVLHGYNDPMVTQNHIETFQKEMDDRQADWQLHSYGNTYHAFSDPKANDPSMGKIYNKLSNRRAWKLAEDFLKEVFIGRI